MISTPKRFAVAPHLGDPQFVRLADTRRAPVTFTLDGREASALEGDTVLSAILSQQRFVRLSEFSGEPRAGFCLIGACQDCWVRTEDGMRIRACTTPIAHGMKIVTRTRADTGSATS